MLQIEVQWPGKSYGEAKQFADHFGCTCEKTKHKGFFIIKTDEPINFYWLGANVNNEAINRDHPSAISKYVEL